MIPVILSGGSGSRLWPVSRQSFPKQFCQLLDESLFDKTVRRLLPLGSPWVVTVRDMQVPTERSLKALGIPVEQAIYEPFGKNTAPAIALLCRLFELRGWSQEIVGIFPADQLILEEDVFRSAVRLGEKIAASGQVVTLGVKPTYPATGYGYIETAGPLASEANAMRAIGFREKPNEPIAREFISRGGFFWNAGMFIFKVEKMVALLKANVPEIWSLFLGLKEDLSNVTDIYNAVRAISIDYAVMERLSEHVCVPCAFDWSDLGSWDAIAGVIDQEKQATKNIVNIDGKDNFVMPQDGKAYGFVGVDELIVVDTPDALLITKKGSSERVKDVVEKLKANGCLSATQHVFDYRPWGKFEILSDNSEFKTKRIVVDKGAQISYQSHAKRAEHWIVVSGKGEVILDDALIAVGAGGHVFIPTGGKHRIRNTGDSPLVFVEVQLGTYFGEDDIVRYADDYKRS